MTRQSVSQSLAQFEQELGIQIFDRSKNGCRLTAEGQIVYRYAVKILTEMEALSQELVQYRFTNCKNFSGQIIFNFSQHFNRSVSKVVEYISGYFPQASAQAYLADYDFLEEVQVLEASEEQLTLYFCAVAEDQFWQVKKRSPFTFIPLSKETMQVCMNKNNSRKFKGAVSLSELSALPLASFASSPKGQGRNFIERYGELYGHTLTCSLVTNNPSIIGAKVLNGSHYAIALSSEMEDVFNDRFQEIVLLPIKDSMPLIRFAAYLPEGVPAAMEKGLYFILQNLKQLFETAST